MWIRHQKFFYICSAVPHVQAFHEKAGECQGFSFIAFLFLFFGSSSLILLFPNCSHSAKPPLVFGERLDEARCSMNGRRQATSSSPGGRSFSSPIHERGQLSRSRQWAEVSEDATAVAARFTL